MNNEDSGWSGYVAHIESLLNASKATGRNGSGMGMDSAFALWVSKAVATAFGRGEILFIGNGASATIASHCSTDVMKHSHLRTRVFTDLSMITAMGNDEGYENSFMIPVRFYSGKGDLLIAISSSGQSENILRAVAAARQNSVFVVTLSAFSPQNPLRTSGDLNFYVQTRKYGNAETCHAAILHHWMDMLAKVRKEHE